MMMIDGDECDDDYTTDATNSNTNVHVKEMNINKNNMKKSQSQSNIGKMKKKKGGKVATLMEMVSRARERLTGSLSESQLPINPTAYEEEEKENIKNDTTSNKSKSKKLKKCMLLWKPKIET